MKRVLYLLMVMMFVAGCSKYEYQLSDPGLTVKQSVLDFTAKGGEGYILVESSTPIVAKSNSDWCNVNVNDKRIDVTVASYRGIENRTAVVAITTGSGFPVNVPVTQSASRFIIGNLSFNVDFVETTVKTHVLSDKPVTVSTNDTWIEASFESDSIFISVSRNNNKDERHGTVEVTSNNITQTITINQGGRSLAFEDVLGEWEMNYQTSATSDVMKRTIRFSQSKTDGYYDVTGLQLGILKVKFNNANKTLEIYSGQNMGTYTIPDNYQGWTIVALTYATDGYISWSESYFYKGVWNNGFDEMEFKFGDSGTWTNKTIYGLYIVVSNKYPVVSGSYKYIGYKYVNISLKKL